MQTDGLDRLLFADDMEECVSTEKIQNSVDQDSESCDSYNLTISIKKTRVQRTLVIATVFVTKDFAVKSNLLL